MEPDDDKTQTHIVLTKGTMVSHYRIVEKIGAGGMGEVYLAEDTELDRKVALKFLPPHLCQDEDCRKRFKREAQAAAKLSHPNIIHVYEVSEYQGRPFFAMEHIEGRSLRDMRAEELDLDRIIGIAIQLCDGLQSAHVSGVIHRDIKPSNIVIDSAGRPKLLDFGLATVIGGEHLTRTGSTLGTVGYMSPEQIGGREIDLRSDIFSLGVVLYELITGRNPFKRDSEAATLKAVSDDLPEPLARFKSGLPEGLQGVVDKALDKDAKTRYQHADGMMSDLRRLLPGLSSSRSDLKAHRSWSRLGLAISLTAIVVVAAIVVALIVIGDEQEALLPPKYTKLTSSGDIRGCDLSPDGEFYAFVRSTEEGRRKFYVADFTGGSPIEVFEHEDWYGLWWSPDGRELLIQVEEDGSEWAYIVPRLGGTPRKYSVPNKRTGWSGDISTIVSVQADKSRLWFLDINSGDTTSVPAWGLEGIDGFCGCSPDGKWLLVTTHTLADGYRLLAVASDGSQTEQLIVGVCGYATWGDAGSDIYAVVYRDDGLALTRVPFDPKTGKAEGQPVTISYDLGYEGQSFSIAGNRMLCTRGTRGSDLWRVEIDPNQNPNTPKMTRLTKSTIHHGSPSISPDGTQIAFNLTDDNRVDVYVMASDGGERTRVTHGGLINVSPEWSLEGTRLLYVCFDNTDARDGTWSIMNLRDGTIDDYPLHDSLCPNEDASWAWDWAPGEQIAFGGCGRLLFLNPETGDMTTLQNLPRDVQLRTAVYAPDGASLGGYWDRDDDSEDGIWIVPLDAESPQFVANLDAYVIGWGPKGDWIYFWREANTSVCEVGRVEIESGSVQILAVLRPGRLPQDNAWLDLSPDATWLVLEVWEQQKDLWLVENLYSELRW